MGPFSASIALETREFLPNFMIIHSQTGPEKRRTRRDVRQLAGFSPGADFGVRF
jgi:hypothetical protein